MVGKEKAPDSTKSGAIILIRSTDWSGIGYSAYHIRLGTTSVGRRVEFRLLRRVSWLVDRGKPKPSRPLSGQWHLNGLTPHLQWRYRGRF